MSARHPAPDPGDIPLMASRSAAPPRRYRDLCSTCNHVKACGGRSTPERPIFFCEQFEISVPAPVAEVQSAASIRPEPRRRRADERKGLCSNCENADACTAPNSEGGIWHCEEYR